jgi:hypothetical protein
MNHHPHPAITSRLLSAHERAGVRSAIGRPHQTTPPKAPAFSGAAGILILTLLLPACQSTDTPAVHKPPVRKIYTPQYAPSGADSSGGSGTHGTGNGNGNGSGSGNGTGSGSGTGSGNGSGSGSGSGSGAGPGSSSTATGGSSSGASTPGGAFATDLPTPSDSPSSPDSAANSNAWASALNQNPTPANKNPAPAKPAAPVPETPKPNVADEIEEKLRGVTVPAPKIDVPDTKTTNDSQKPGANLIGSWNQTSSLGKPDFSDGGYTARTLIFQPSGTLIVSSAFDKDAVIKGARSFRWSIDKDGKLLIDPVPGKDNNATNVEFNLGDSAVTPATLKVPATLPYKITGQTLTLDEKTYKKQ